MNLFFKYICNIGPISYVVVATLIIGLLFLNKSKKISKYLLLILFISSFVEIVGYIALECKMNLSYLYNFFFIVHNGLWLFVASIIIKKKFINTTIIWFLIFAFLNLFYTSGSKLNSMTFVISALLYILIFIIESYRQLKNENLDYFSSNKYLLLFAPVLFFFGFSFIFSFRSFDVKNSIVFGKTDLYTFISFFVNVLYYSLINLYIYRESKIKND